MRELKMGVKAREWEMELVVTITLKYSECRVKPRIHSTHSLLPTHLHSLTLTHPRSLIRSRALSPPARRISHDQQGR